MQAVNHVKYCALFVSDDHYLTFEISLLWFRIRSANVDVCTLACVPYLLRTTA